ncbi:unnamed protein product, partial [Acidithrix sp. C25]
VDIHGEGYPVNKVFFPRSWRWQDFSFFNVALASAGVF